MISYGDGGALDYAMQSAATAEQAVLTARRFIRLLNGQLSLDTERRDTQAVVRLETRIASPHSGFVFSASAFTAPLPSADPKLHRILVAHLTSELAELPEVIR